MSRSKFMAMIMVASFFGLVAVVITSQRTIVVASFAAPASISMRGASQFYAQHNIVSDIPGLADHTDSNVVNAWGLDSGQTTPWWIADNGTGKTTLYNISNGATSFFTVPGAGGAQGNPTGLIFNGGTGFVVNNGSARVQRGLSLPVRTAQSRRSEATQS